MGEHDNDPDQRGPLQNFKNLLWFRLARVGLLGVKCGGSMILPWPLLTGREKNLSVGE
jgi:hypothetical protein